MLNQKVAQHTIRRRISVGCSVHQAELLDSSDAPMRTQNQNLTNTGWKKCKSSKLFGNSRTQFDAAKLVITSRLRIRDKNSLYIPAFCTLRSKLNLCDKMYQLLLQARFKRDWMSEQIWKQIKFRKNLLGLCVYLVWGKTSFRFWAWKQQNSQRKIEINKTTMNVSYFVGSFLEELLIRSQDLVLTVWLLWIFCIYIETILEEFQ